MRLVASSALSLHHPVIVAPVSDNVAVKPWRHGAVYAIGHRQPNGDIVGPFKVGRVGPGSVIKNRLTALQVGTPAPLAVALIQPVRFSSSAIEGLVHLALANRRTRGEWFDCSIARIQQVIAAALKYERDTIPRKINASPAALVFIRAIVIKRGADAINQWKQWDN